MGRALHRRPAALGHACRAAERRARVSPPRASCSRASFGVAATADNETAIAGAEIVVLAVKPQEAQAVLTPLAPTLAAARPLLISVLAGTRVAALEAWCGSEVPVVRAMPNRPALVGAGVSGMYAPLKVNAAQRSARQNGPARRWAKSCGWPPRTPWTSSPRSPASGPAYFFLLAECMAEAGQQLGLEHAVAQRLAAVTLYGSGLMAHAETAISRGCAPK